MKTQWAATLVAALMLSGCQKGPSVDDAWVRLPAVPGRPAAGYATVRGGSGNDVLTSVASPAVQRAELHESMESHGGMMAMRALAKVKVEGSIGFSPGGKHIMLFGLSPDLRAGGTIPMTFAFEDGSKVTVDAKLVAAGDPEP